MREKSLETILLAEDNDGHARLIELALEEAKARNPLIRFNNGLGAWEFISGKSKPGLEPDKRYLILLDIRMPVMDGIELLRRISAAPSINNLRVAIITTSEDSADQRRCRELGCEDFLIKPVTAGKLLDLITS
jgi:CheY-like chemotaxis protein